MSMNYESYILRLTSFIVKEPSDLDYSVVIPATIDAAEQRVYRELDLLSTVVRDKLRLNYLLLLQQTLIYLTSHQETINLYTL